MHGPLIRSVIRVDFEDSEKAHVVYSSIKPDNKPLPQGLHLEAIVEGATVVVNVECSRGLESFLATIDDLLRMMALSEKVYIKLRGES